MWASMAGDVPGPEGGCLSIPGLFGPIKGERAGASGPGAARIMIFGKSRVVKIGEDGTVTLSLPGMAGQYLVIEQEEGRLVLRPYDLRWEGAVSTIAKVGVRLHHLPLGQDRLPEA
jgi:hypothetical protein